MIIINLIPYIKIRIILLMIKGISYNDVLELFSDVVDKVERRKVSVFGTTLTGI